MFNNWKQPICVVRTRQLKMQDLVFSLRPKKSSYSSLEVLERAGLVYDLKPEDEEELLKALVELHPIEQKNFEHFLINPPADILPSRIKVELAKRTRMIPTLFIAYFSLDGEVQHIEMVSDYYQLLSICSDAREDGLIPPTAEGQVNEAC